MVASLCGLATASAEEQKPLQRLVVASEPADDVTPLLYAIKSGMFERRGLDVRILKMTSGAAVTAGVVGGSIDVGKSSVVPIVNAYRRGIPVEIVAPGELAIAGKTPTALLVLKDSPLRTGGDFAGKTISTSALGDLMSLGVHAWIDRSGSDSSSVHYVELPSPTALAALEAHRVDGAVVTDPILHQILASGKVRIVTYPDEAIAPSFLITGWFANRHFVDTHRDAIDRFAETMLEASRYANTHHAQTVDLIATFAGVTPAVIEHGGRVPLCEQRDYAGVLQPVLDAALKYGVLTAPIDARQLIASSKNR